MIGKLKGVVEEKEDDSLILDVGGVGYHVFASSRLLSELTLGQEIKLTIEMNVREDHIHLYGFPNNVERDWFLLLATVQGVGNKTALAILAAYAPARLVQAILAKDIAAFKAISGIGPKLAERIVTELKDKVSKMPSADFVPITTKSQTTNYELRNTHLEDTISALSNLGYSRSEAFTAANKVASTNESANLDALICLSLKELVRS